MVNENPIVVVLRVVFGPLLKQASKLPPALAYGLATIIVISVVSLLGIILPPRVIYLIAVIALACLVAFVFLDWDTRRNHAVKTNIQDTNDDSKTPIPITSAKPSAPAVKATIKRSLQKHAVVDHERLIGVDELLHDIKERLIESEGSWIISLFGEGGVGKTALAYETVKRYISDQFTRFAWVSAKQR